VRAEAAGGQVGDGRELERWAATDFAGLVVQTARTRFPLPYVSAGHAADGFLQLARGFVAAAQPELRQALGRAMAQAAACCQRMLELDDQAHEAAFRAAQRRRFGEED
jgi:hypothetical protein